jgi:Tol biopolymer transport system component
MNLSPYQKTASTLLSTLLLAGVCLGQSTERASVSSSGVEGNDWSDTACISADGRFVAFESNANNLVAGDTTPRTDIFVRDLVTGATERVSVSSAGVGGNRDSVRPSISADGRFVAFESPSDNLVPGDTNQLQDVFVHDRLTGLTEHASVNSSGVGGNLEGCNASISADGRYVAFHGHSDNLVPGDTNGQRDAFVHDRLTGLTERVSVSSLGVEGNHSSGDASISADGRYVAFQSTANNLVPGDTNLQRDIFVHDRQTGVTERVSVSSLGGEGNDWSYEPSISADGRFVSFESLADNLVPADTNAHGDVFVHDNLTGVTERVSVDSFCVEGNYPSTFASLSEDGRYVAFTSWASNLVSGDTNAQSDIFVHDRWSGTGQNSIFLTGPATASVGAPIQFSWQTTRGESRYWLASSRNMNGSVISGHSFDLGTPMNLLASGMNSINGMGSFTTAPIPPRAAGHTIYFEVAARDSAGVLYDSNPLAVTIN